MAPFLSFVTTTHLPLPALVSFHWFHWLTYVGWPLSVRSIVKLACGFVDLVCFTTASRGLRESDGVDWSSFVCAVDGRVSIAGSSTGAACVASISKTPLWSRRGSSSRPSGIVSKVEGRGVTHRARSLPPNSANGSLSACVPVVWADMCAGKCFSSPLASSSASLTDFFPRRWRLMRRKLIARKIIIATPPTAIPTISLMDRVVWVSWFDGTPGDPCDVDGRGISDVIDEVGIIEEGSAVLTLEGWGGIPAVMIVCLVTVTTESFGTVWVVPESVILVILGSGALPVMVTILPSSATGVMERLTPEFFPSAIALLSVIITILVCFCGCPLGRRLHPGKPVSLLAAIWTKGLEGGKREKERFPWESLRKCL